MLNKWMGIGHLGGVPETRLLDDGNKVANFSLATTEKYKNRDGKKIIKTTWVKITAFGSVADVMEKYLTKGSKIYVEGRLNNRSFTDRKGKEREVMEVVASVFVMLDKKEDE